MITEAGRIELEVACRAVERVLDLEELLFPPSVFGFTKAQRECIAAARAYSRGEIDLDGLHQKKHACNPHAPHNSTQFAAREVAECAASLTGSRRVYHAPKVYSKRACDSAQEAIYAALTSLRRAR